jgi:hypothetical protein
MSISPLRRIAAVAAVAGVTALGGLAVAPAALADQGGNGQASAGTALVVALPDMTADPTAVKRNDAGYIQSPLPDASVSFRSDLNGRYSNTLPPRAAQVFQSQLANQYASLGHLITFSEHGALVVGPKICDPSQSTAWNEGCVSSTVTPGGRF